MPSSIERGPGGSPSAEAELIHKIEELSFLRTLNDRLARAPDHTSAAQTLVDLIWDEAWADVVTYFSIDPQRRVCRLEARAPGRPDADSMGDSVRQVSIQDQPFPSILDQREPVVVLDDPPPAWLAAAMAASPESTADSAFLAAPMRVRGSTRGVLLVCARRDTTDLEEQQRLLAIAATSAALALDVARTEAREEFLATLRHDINSPIAAALGCAEVLAHELRGNETLADFAQGIVGSLNAVTDLVSNYLHLSAIDQGAPWLHLERVDLGELAASVVERLRASATQQGLTLVFEQEGPPIVADRRQLERVIDNLVSNAIKYTPPGGRVAVSVSSDDAGATIRVRDTGFGLGADELARLFTKYSRFHADRGIPGTGLGLFISKALVEAHGGRIDVTSEPGRGSSFVVSLPGR